MQKLAFKSALPNLNQALDLDLLSYVERSVCGIWKHFYSCPVNIWSLTWQAE